jgi:hypothetical protein
MAITTPATESLDKTGKAITQDIMAAAQQALFVGSGPGVRDAAKTEIDLELDCETPYPKWLL